MEEKDKVKTEEADAAAKAKTAEAAKSESVETDLGKAKTKAPTEAKKPTAPAKPTLKEVLVDLARAILFHGMFLGLVAVGVYLTATAVATGSILMFFTGIAIAATSLIERNSLMDESKKVGNKMPNLFKALYDTFGKGFEKIIDKSAIRKEKAIEMAEAKAATAAAAAKAGDSKTGVDKKGDTPAKPLDFEKELIEAEISRRKYSEKTKLPKKGAVKKEAETILSTSEGATKDDASKGAEL